ncbi:MAG: PQQ-dependent sugar dehydrogenase, partial [Pseudomonadota bacterium]|nr:PQQ-dependent sugar dehydrogenase [Pseudomonadota bacterium]
MKSWLALSALLFSTALLASESESVKNSTLNSTLNTTQPSVLQSLAERVEINTVIDALSYPKAITTVVDKEKSTTHIIITTRDGELIVVNDERKVSRFTLPLDNLYTKGQGGVLDILIPFSYPQDKTVLLSYSKGSD